MSALKVWAEESGRTDVVTVDNKGNVKIVGAGEATITVNVAESKDGNYAATTKTVTVTVNPKEISLDWSNLSFEFDGKAHVPTATIPSGSVVNNDCTVSVTVKSEAKDAGRYTATAAISNTKDYVLADSEDGTTTKQFDITPKKVKVVWDDEVSFPFDGKAHLPEAAVDEDDLVEGAPCVLAISLDGVQVARDAGKYTALAVSASKNYAVDTDTATQKFEITAIEKTCEADVDIETLLCGTKFESLKGNAVIAAKNSPVQSEDKTPAAVAIKNPMLGDIEGFLSVKTGEDFSYTAFLLPADIAFEDFVIASYKGDFDILNFTVDGDKTYSLILIAYGDSDNFDNGNFVLTGLDVTAKYGDVVLTADDITYTAIEGAQVALISLKAEHIEGEEVEDASKYVKPECEVEGSKTFVKKCTACGDVLSSRTESVDPTDHDWDYSEKIYVNEPTYTEKGEYYYLCKNDESHESEHYFEHLYHSHHAYPQLAHRPLARGRRRREPMV